MPKTAFQSLSRRRRAAALLLLLLVLATIAFIWNNSLQSPDESLRRSDMAEGLTRPVILAIPVEAWHTPAMITYITRKLGHFIEFFALGAELLCLWLLVRPAMPLPARYLLLISVCVAGADEALQSTNGRGPSFWDVGLDAFGAAAGLLFMLAAQAVYQKIGRKVRA